ncbi:hypothetical protein BDP55DRAFT_439883 [Colletotrichum godetiae]|uniref:Uncharacterized protein n=1 Tax=Colletotrichum godetiae TaxID=1209918 RepID=A0AAJ0ELB2_9PEZI|nr:uncharacterized protein BDP55DRAFT_439883 [Colletotrichum godetiae]KAK1657345.1 hypothetical protein BDP55DRAFT_439883 [Colletotrichum godetiae]
MVAFRENAYLTKQLAMDGREVIAAGSYRCGVVIILGSYEFSSFELRPECSYMAFQPISAKFYSGHSINQFHVSMPNAQADVNSANKMHSISLDLVGVHPDSAAPASIPIRYSSLARLLSASSPPAHVIEGMERVFEAFGCCSTSCSEMGHRGLSSLAIYQHRKVTPGTPIISFVITTHDAQGTRDRMVGTGSRLTNGRGSGDSSRNWSSWTVSFDEIGDPGNSRHPTRHRRLHLLVSAASDVSLA